VSNLRALINPTPTMNRTRRELLAGPIAAGKAVRAYLINTADRTIAEVDYGGHSTHICDLCSFEFFTIYKRWPFEYLTVVELNEERDVVFVANQNLLERPITEITEFFGFLGYARPLAGNGLVLGTDEEGESIEPKQPFAWFKDRLCWIERVDGQRWTVQNASGRGAQHMSRSEVEQFLARPLA